MKAKVSDQPYYDNLPMMLKETDEEEDEAEPIVKNDVIMEEAE